MKATIASIIIATALIGGVFILAKGGGNDEQTSNGNNVTIVDGRQIIEIRAKGGYQPSKSVAKAGIPTILRFRTGGTFDCSSSIRIPSLNIARILPQSGTTDIDIGSQQITSLRGTCGMGMYPFEVEFKS